MYRIKTEKFEGPFEVLVDLIDRKKLSINEISLAEIAGQFLDYLKEIGNFPVGEVASFVVVAATLMLIKSRSLMPWLKFSEEEELEIENLEQQLKLYKKFKALAGGLEKIFGKKVIFAREPFSRIEKVLSIPLGGIKPKDLSILNLKKALVNVLNNLPAKEIPLPKALVKKTVSLEQRIDELIKKMESRVKMCFSEIKNNPECQKIDLIVNFLALLELTKRGLIILKQEQSFGEIEITRYDFK
ncbi:segregation/condensation protein A [Patescibacteria group bacterium]|nr:segregation/condensation protein A [Patescibacteria group bacterium]